MDQNFPPFFPEKGRKVDFPPGRRAEGGFYPGPTYLLRGALHPWTSRVPMVALVVVIVMPMAPSYRQVKKTFNMRGNKSDKGKDD